MSTFLFYLGHPAHYHNFKNPIRELTSEGHRIVVVARDKDVLFQLLENEHWDIIKLPQRKGKSKVGMVLNILAREIRMLRLSLMYKPDLLIGTDLVITHIGKLLGVPSIVVNEDDSEAVPLMAKYAFPFATKILAPNCCDQSPSNHKKIGYEGYHELCYLHPRLFSPDRSKLPAEIRNSEKYFILRFASLSAHHDEGRQGINDELALQLIEILREAGDVYITSERNLPETLEPYRIGIHPSQMHNALAFSSGYIGDSQTMAAEAAVLGVPSIRFNDFVGELNYLEELEKKYKLTIGLKSNEKEKLIELVKKWVELNQKEDELKTLQKTMLDSTVDVCKLWVEVFENQALNHR